MFRKLLKHEFQSVGKWYLGIYIASLVLSVVLGFWLQALALRTPIGNTEPNVGEMVLLGTSFMTFGILIAALFLSTFFLVINRFRKNVYGRQGYLTMTLPVDSHQIILSKLLVSLVWYILAIITAIFSIGIVITLIMMPSDKNALSQLQIIIQNLNWTTLFSRFIYGLIEIIANILLIYFSISVGQLFKDHRFLFAVLTYVGIGIVVGVLSAFLHLNSSEALSGLAFSLYPSPILSLINIILSFAYYFGTYFIMTKKLNLQ
ncbi:ABC transporter permease [Streptococcus ruminantium]|uniref:ABC transporter permease n=1 Tax=Streptococcus ruminantium TaxID=1917441 RepID=UPI0012DF230C|nr:ABC transporter permease [Streptococcus ruminantium]